MLEKDEKELIVCLIYCLIMWCMPVLIGVVLYLIKGD